jgi:hypothetical protein
MKRDVADGYRRDVEDLIASQNRDLPICPSDGKPCLTPERQIVWFGVMASDGKEEIVCSCPRFKPKRRRKERSDLSNGLE